MVLAIDRFITPEGVLAFTLTSNSYKFLTLNLLTHLKRAGVPWTFAIVCADKASHRFFRQEGYPALLMDGAEADYGPRLIPFGTRLFQGLNRKKLDLLAEFAARPEVRIGVYLDGDIAVYSDPVPDLLARFEAAPADVNLLIQCDEQTRVACSGISAPCPQACSGVFAWRHGIPPIVFRVAESPATWSACPEDQVFLNRRLADLAVPFQTLPRDAYPNGQFVAAAAAKDAAILLHYNWIVGDMKRKRMIANGDWLIPY